MKRILLIATLIFISCAAAPARPSGDPAGDDLRPENSTTPRPVVGESADANGDGQ
jgi:hypothetical protein